MAEGDSQTRLCGSFGGMSSPFDLELIMLAMPSLKPPKPPYHIDMLPTEILCMIFDYFSHLSSSGRGQVQPIILLSHISTHPTLWDNVDINSYRRPDVLRAILARSNQRSLSIRIDWPETIFWSSGELPDFNDTCAALVEQLPRIRNVSIKARNLTLRNFTDKVLVNIALPHLQHLELISSTDSSPILLGPFDFDPNVFISLLIKRTMVHVRNGHHLAGLRRFVLSEARLSYLDERKIPSTAPPANPATWYTELPIPSLSSLTNLEIHAPLVHPVPGRPAQPIFDMHGQNVPHLPFAPSFRTDTLRSVTLSSLSLSRLDYGVQVTSEILARLFRIISLAELYELHLIDLRDHAISAFLQALALQHCRFSYLRILKFTDVPLEDIVGHSEEVGLENFEYLFSHAFPALDPTPLVEILRTATLWPMLQRVEHEGTVLDVSFAGHV
ncbi:hypothetical protein F5887DRAFT_948368 [Amanita rubescens]|nr:hypothetical protein F5887DRAFT_948368 [Amanita rubescens]